MDRNSIIALFLLYRRRKRRRNGLHWIQPIIIKNRDEFGAFAHYWINIIHRDDANMLLN